MVVYDENELDADTIQNETHKASYMYARATKAVSIVPPVYYADLACQRARLYLGRLMRDVEAAPRREKGTREDTDERLRVYQEAEKLFGEGVHPDLKDTMFYI